MPASSTIWIHLAGLLRAAVVLHAQPRGNPEHPHVKLLQPWGIMQGGQLPCSSGAEDVARYIWPLGDVNHDNIADWIVTRIRCDTAIDVYGSPFFGQELLVYKGVLGGLPTSTSGERIGPSELGSETSFLASGDWDDDGNRDLAVRIHFFNDTTSGDTSGHNTSILVVFWGNIAGHFSLNDTSRLSCGADRWLGIYPGFSYDIDGDGADDLLINNSGGFSNGRIMGAPVLQIFKGHAGKRWGREGVARVSDWKWWTPPPITRIQRLDQDCDGYQDVVMYYDESPRYSQVSVLYGRHESMPDTSEYERILLDTANGRYSLLTDLTGDGIPELAVNCGSQERIKLYAGKPGQRLRAQYGTGIEPENGRPWAEIWLPQKIHDGWSAAGFGPLYDLGDVNLDGVNDLWTYSDPLVICYTGGQYMDSLIDAEFDVRGHGAFSSAVRLGDIDGSKTHSFALTFTGRPGTLYFFKSTDSVPSTGVYRELPHAPGFRCEHAAGVHEQRARDTMPSVRPKLTLRQ